MAKLSQQQEKELQIILTDLKKAYSFLHQKNIKVCTTSLPNTNSFYNKDGEGLTPINKDAGSALQYLDKALDDFSHFLSANFYGTLTH